MPQRRLDRFAVLSIRKADADLIRTQSILACSSDKKMQSTKAASYYAQISARAFVLIAQTSIQYRDSLWCSKYINRHLGKTTAS